MNSNKQATYVELPVFQGSLDLLLHLIQKNKINIYDIPIAEIADQFIETIRTYEAFDLEITSEFLVLAAQLLFLKSRQLLPEPQKSPDDLLMEQEIKQDLIDRLITYKTFKNISAYLASREESTGDKFFREVNLEEIMLQITPPDPLEGIATIDLLNAFEGILKRVEKGEPIPLYVQIEQIPVDLMINDIIRKIILKPKGIRFREMLRYNSKAEIIIAFIALLDLLKDGKVKSEQKGKNHDIFIVPTEKLLDFEDGKLD